MRARSQKKGRNFDARDPFQPEQASSIARRWTICIFSSRGHSVFTIVIFSIIFYFMLKYRRRSPDERPKAIEGLAARSPVDGIPHFDVAAIFVWGSSLYSKFGAAARSDGNIVTGKQFMWRRSTRRGSAKSTNCMCRSGGRSSSP